MKKYIIVLLAIILTYPPVFAADETEFTYDSQGARDPFIPLLTKDGKPITTYAKIGSISDVVVEGILYDPQGESIVVINDIVLKEGDGISGITVKSIEKNSVVLSFKDKEHTLKIKE